MISLDVFFNHSKMFNIFEFKHTDAKHDIYFISLSFFKTQLHPGFQFLICWFPRTHLIFKILSPLIRFPGPEAANQTHCIGLHSPCSLFNTAHWVFKISKLNDLSHHSEFATPTLHHCNPNISNYSFVTPKKVSESFPCVCQPNGLQESSYWRYFVMQWHLLS